MKHIKLFFIVLILLSCSCNKIFNNKRYENLLERPTMGVDNISDNNIYEIFPEEDLEYAFGNVDYNENIGHCIGFRMGCIIDGYKQGVWSTKDGIEMLQQTNQIVIYREKNILMTVYTTAHLLYIIITEIRCIIPILVKEPALKKISIITANCIMR